MSTWTNQNKNIDGYLLTQSGDYLTQQDGGLLKLFSAIGWSNISKTLSSFFFKIDNTNSLLIDSTNKLSIQDTVGTSWSNITKN